MIDLGKPRERDLELDICEAEIEEALARWEAAKIIGTVESKIESYPIDYPKEGAEIK